MRDAPVPAVPAPVPVLRRCALLCGTLVLVTSCGWGMGDDGDEGGGPPGAPTGVTAEAGSATTVHVMWNAVDGVERPTSSIAAARW